MHLSLATLGVAAIPLAFMPLVRAGPYQLKDNYSGPSFLTGFVHENMPDPTHGRVNYVDQNTALSKNLTYAHGDTLVLRADSTTQLNPSGPGRDSIRIRSIKTYQTHVAVFEIRHMPEGAATWPAAWEVSTGKWPDNGEVDIVEGANDQGPNKSTLHTSDGCSMPAQRQMQGDASQPDSCGNQPGCGVTYRDPQSYGPIFNKVGGGYYVLERTTSDIKMWFFLRNGWAPDAVKNAASTIDTSGFPTPNAWFPSTQCDLTKHFAAHNIVINLTLCGDWAGQTFNQNGKSGVQACNDWVNSNPAAFANAYWDIAGIRVYE